MDEKLYPLPIKTLDSLDNETQHQALVSLEEGKVIYLPNYSFSLQLNEQKDLLSEKILDRKHKNISFDYRNQRLGGFHSLKNLDFTPSLQGFMKRYADFAKALIDSLFPHYQEALRWGRTSYRPAEIKGRVSSKRKDDTRLHVDSFPATPVHGQRILRVFTNINPYHEPRVWHLGEPFRAVLLRFGKDIPAYKPLRAKILYWLKATKSLRTAYDHYQLHLHDKMKLSDHYQQTVAKERFDFPAGSTWIVFTDQVSHAALSGQFLLEQTFYLPVEAMAKPSLSPLGEWEAQLKIAHRENSL